MIIGWAPSNLRLHPTPHDDRSVTARGAGEPNVKPITTDRQWYCRGMSNSRSVELYEANESQRGVQFVVLCLLAVAVIGCGGSPSGPSPGRSSYEGSWTGTTTQGRSISFLVSRDAVVTSITVDYSLNGCSGVSAYPNLSQPVQDMPGVPGSRGPGFGYEEGHFTEPNYLQVVGSFTSNSTASGLIAFGEYRGCGNGVANWTASKR